MTSTLIGRPCYDHIGHHIIDTYGFLFDGVFEETLKVGKKNGVFKFLPLVPVPISLVFPLPALPFHAHPKGQHCRDRVPLQQWSLIRHHLLLSFHISNYYQRTNIQTLDLVLMQGNQYFVELFREKEGRDMNFMVSETVKDMRQAQDNKSGSRVMGLYDWSSDKCGKEDLGIVSAAGPPYLQTLNKIIMVIKKIVFIHIQNKKRLCKLHFGSYFIRTFIANSHLVIRQSIIISPQHVKNIDSKNQDAVGQVLEYKSLICLRFIVDKLQLMIWDGWLWIVLIILVLFNRRFMIILISVMGNSYCCQEYYQALPCTNSKSTDLKAKLRQHFHNSQFRDICLRAVERHYDDTLQLEKEEILRHSVAAYSHYESNCISQSINEDIASSRQTIDGYQFSPVAAMPHENRERYLLKLIRESYLFLDFSDCIDNRKSYDHLMRNQVIRGDPSLASFIGESTYIAHLEQQLRSFNEELIGKLENYVRFCRKVKHDFMPDRERFLSKLNLALQAEIIRKFLNRDFRKSTGTLEEMMADVEEILRILILTVESMYDFRMEGEGLVKEEEFFNSLNIYTMLTSILFQSEEFTGFIINKLKECFRQRFTAYRTGGTYSVGDFISDFIALNSDDSRREARITQSSSSHLLSYSKYDSIPLFERTQRMLLKMFVKPVPIFKLKVVFELTQEMAKEMEELRSVLKERYGVSLGTVFTRETDLLAIKWLLRRSSDSIDEICSHLVFTYYFVHRMHLVDRKGSSLITFMQEVERIIQWARPL